MRGVKLRGMRVVNFGHFGRLAHCTSRSCLYEILFHEDYIRQNRATLSSSAYPKKKAVIIRQNANINILNNYQ